MKFLPPVIPAVFLTLLLLLPLSRDVAGEPAFPSPLGAVNDFAGIIPAPDRDAMERLAGEVLSKTGTALVVATVSSTEGEDPDEYANRLYEAWGIGKKGEDRGVLMFLALKEKRIRIETGYGMEGLLPDGLVGSLLDTYVLPDLRRGAFGPGFLNGMKALAGIIARDAGVSLSPGAAPVPAGNPQKRKGGSLLSTLFFILVLFLLLGTRRGRAMLPYILLLALSGGGRGSSGGGFGSFGGGFGGFGGGMSGGGGAGRSF